MFVLITSVTSCGLLHKSNKTEKVENKAEEATDLVMEEGEEMEVPEPKEVLPSIIEMKTTKGDIVIRLYEETPLHRANMKKLIDENYYDGLLFHRVIKDFMIQGGDPNSRDADPNTRLGNGGPGYTIPAEITQKVFHKKGALCAARQGDNVNPEKRSSGSQFYIVTGAVYSLDDLKQMEIRINQQAKATLMQKYWADPKNEEMAQLYAKYKSEFKQDSLNILISKLQRELDENYVSYKFTEEQIKVYTSEGGAPFLDNGYTVYGEVVEGIEVVEEIEKVKTNGERPIEDVRIISIKILE